MAARIALPGDAVPLNRTTSSGAQPSNGRIPAYGGVDEARGGRRGDCGRHETNESIMMFEETVPPGTKSLFHLHRDSDEVAWVLAGEITFRIGDEVSVGGRYGQDAWA